MSYVKGDVSVQRASDQAFEQGEVNLALVQGDKLGTKDGRAEVHFGKSNYLRLDADTQVDLYGLPQRDGDAYNLHLLTGRIFLRIAFLDREKAFEVHTPDASFYILDQGLYRFEVGQNRETEVFVLDGSLEAAGQEGSVQVNRNEELTAVNGTLRSARDETGSPRDDFSDWNADRDEVHRPRASTRYLPEEINEYQDELDAYGRWTYERPYGYVWVPYVYETDWRPYYNGHWVWYPIIGWTWVSYEPWGWACYHYGRWHWRMGLGWYWIPTRYWGPAWVHWWWDYDYCGWCPLGWYNRPIVIINNYFYDRYDRRDYPAHNRAMTIVRRDQLQARRISREALSADQLKRVGAISLRAQQPDIKPVVDRTGLEQRLGARVLNRDGLRPVRSDAAPGAVRPDRSRLPGAVRDLKAGGVLERRLGRASGGMVRDPNLPRREIDLRGGAAGAGVSRSEIKTYPARIAPSSWRSDFVERRSDQDSSAPRLDPRKLDSRSGLREYESRELRSSPETLGGLLRTFRSRLSESVTRSGDRDWSDDPSPRSRYDYGRDDGPSDSRRYSIRSRDDGSSPSSGRPSYSPRSSGSRPSPRSSSSPSRGSSSPSHSGSSGRVRRR